MSLFNVVYIIVNRVQSGFSNNQFSKDRENARDRGNTKDNSRDNESDERDKSQTNQSNQNDDNHSFQNTKCY